MGLVTPFSIRRVCLAWVFTGLVHTVKPVMNSYVQLPCSVWRISFPCSVRVKLGSRGKKSSLLLESLGKATLYSDQEMLTTCKRQRVSTPGWEMCLVTIHMQALSFPYWLGSDLTVFQNCLHFRESAQRKWRRVGRGQSLKFWGGDRASV